MIPSRRRSSWRLPPLPKCGVCGKPTSAGVSVYGKGEQSMSARTCDSCHRELLLAVLCVPASIEPEVSMLVNQLQECAA